MRLVKYFSILLIILCSNFCQSQILDDFDDGNFTDNPTWIGDDSLFQVNGLGQLQSKGSANIGKDIYLATQSYFLKGSEWNFLVRFNLSPSTQNFCRFYLLSDSSNLKASTNNAYYVQFGGITGNNDSVQFVKQVGTNRTILIGGRRGTVSKSNNLLRLKMLRDSLGFWQMFSDTLGADDYALEGSVFDSTLKGASYIGFWAKHTTTNANNYYLDDVYVGPIRTDLEHPQLLKASFISDHQTYLVFNEKLDNVSSTLVLNYIVDNGIGRPISVSPDPDNVNAIILSFDKAFVNGKSYILSLANINDRFNNQMPSKNVELLYYVTQKHDVLITEIFPDPSPSVGLPDAEFIEIYNHSKIPINLNNWSVSDPSTTSYLPDVVIKPDSFIVFCALSNESKFSSYGKTIGLSAFPSLNNDSDSILLKDDIGKLIHQVNYNTSWYKDASKKDGGWTLEMFNPFSICLDGDNWQGSQAAQGGTPGKYNSTFKNHPDTTRPGIKSLEPIDSLQLLVVFDSKMDEISLQLSSVKLNGVSVSSKQIIGQRKDSMMLVLTSALLRDNIYLLSFDTLKNCLGNASINISKSFVFIPQTTDVKQNDIIITEVFANPKPVGLLPNAEWIELHNRSKNIVRLNNWKLKKGNTSYTFPNTILYPDSYVVVCDANDQQSLSILANVVVLNSFPSLALDDELTLLNEQNFIIHNLSYKNDWMNDKLKQSAAWSLEMMDVNNPCMGEGNWGASINPKGATPGKINSVHTYNPDKSELKLLRAYPIDNKTLVLVFNKTLDSLSSNAYTHYWFNNINKGISYHHFIDNSLSRIELQMSDSFLSNTTYRIRIDSLADCANNFSVDRNYADFGLSEKADSNDLHINEVLFNPSSSGADFVELYNSSNKFIDLKDYLICNTDERDSINQFNAFGTDYWQIHPKQFIVLTDSKDKILSNHSVAFSDQIIELKTMPSYNDDAGTVLLSDLNGGRIEKFVYDDKMHFALIENKEAVSLERINPFRPVNDRSNWTSSSAGVNYATPTTRNSQYFETNQNSSALLIQPEVFSPDGDGYHDVVNFNYQFSETGNVAKLEIYNSSGLLVKTLFKNELLGSSGTYSWNGIDEHGNVPAYGIYIANFEVFSINEESQTYRKTFVLGGKL